MEQETATCYVVQYRVRIRQDVPWGRWVSVQDYRRSETATKECDRRREQHKADDNIGWRVLKVTQEVVY